MTVQPSKTICMAIGLPLLRDALEAALKAEGYSTRTAADGAVAIRALGTSRPDLLILDTSLPGVSGLGVLKRLRADPRTAGLPVMMLSDETSRPRVLETVGLGVSAYLVKNEVTLAALLERVRRVLNPPARATPQPAPAKPPAGAPTPTEPAPEGPPAPAPVGAAPIKPLLTRGEVLERLAKMGELSGFSPAVSQVVNLVSNSRCSAEQIAKAVSYDQGLSLKVLRVANSSAYSRGDRVDTVHKAILRIGMEQMRDTAMSIGVIERFGSADTASHLTAPLFWEHAIACGIIAAEIAHLLGHKDTSVAFTSGLLHDLGRMILLEQVRDEYPKVLSHASEAGIALDEAEARLLSITHAELMDHVLRTWHFPADLVAPIVHHHVEARDARGAAPQKVAETLRLGLANRLAHALFLGASGNDVLAPIEGHCRVLGLGAESIATIRATARQQTDEMKLSMLARSTSEPWPRRLDQLRARLGTPFRPLFVSASPDIDAYHIMCSELGEPPGANGPNIAVAHVATAKEAEGVSKALLAAERAAKCGPLPTIVLSPGNHYHLDAQAVPGRTVSALPTPLHLGRFIDAVRALTGASEAKKAA